MKRFLRSPSIVVPAALCLSLTGVIGLAGVIEATPASAAAPGFTCTGTVNPFNYETIPAGTYASLTMPPGSLCVISGDVTVNHPVTLGSGSGLGLVGGSLTVNGTLTVGPDAAFGDFGDFNPITVNGSAFVQNNGVLVMLGGVVGGSVLATAPSSLLLFGSQVSGSVSVSGGGGANPVEEAIPGGIPSPFIELEGNLISGSVNVTGYATTVGTEIFENTTGPMTLANNSALFVGSNVINGPATCSGNTPPVTDFGTSTATGPTKGDQGTACFG